MNYVERASTVLADPVVVLISLKLVDASSKQPAVDFKMLVDYGLGFDSMWKAGSADIPLKFLVAIGFVFEVRDPFLVEVVVDFSFDDRA